MKHYSIDNYREDQLTEYLISNNGYHIDTVKCDCCKDEVEESETEYLAMHDINDGRKMNYCKTCIELYREENL